LRRVYCVCIFTEGSTVPWVGDPEASAARTEAGRAVEKGENGGSEEQLSACVTQKGSLKIRSREYQVGGRHGKTKFQGERGAVNGEGGGLKNKLPGVKA